jgi:HEPN domain-containing protein
MNPATAEWIEKAEGDFATAGRELRARKSPNYDAVCFHAQQCAEKYLKAVLQENEKHIPKIHNLIELMLLCEKIDSSFEMLRSDLVVMERYSVRVRYPGEFAEKADAQSAYAAAKTTRAFIMQKLDLK